MKNDTISIILFLFGMLKSLKAKLFGCISRTRIVLTHRRYIEGIYFVTHIHRYINTYIYKYANKI